MWQPFTTSTVNIGPDELLETVKFCCSLVSVTFPFCGLLEVQRAVKQVPKETGTLSSVDGRLYLFYASLMC